MVKPIALGMLLTGLMLPLLAAGAGQAQKAGANIVVYKDPGCGCCEKWVDHLRAHGFTATVSEADMDAVKAKYKVPAAGRSCHTGIVDGYVIEGHVPAADIQRLLKERPAVVGIAVPGMPIGSPGMEIDGVKADAYKSVAWDKDGNAHVFAAH
jgi:hypothetical protein